MGIGGQMFVLVTIILWLVLLASQTAILGNSKVVAAKNEIDQERRKLIATEQNQGFISIDCGAEEDYLDKTTGIFYRSDKNFISTGVNKDISPQYNYINQEHAMQLKNLRAFPDGTKNCYTLRPEQGKNHHYLIRTYFKYGNYDGKNQIPVFDIYIGTYYMATLALENVTKYVYYETFHFSLSDSIYLCLVNTGSGIPFISAVELRSLNNSIYRTPSGTAGLNRRYDVGSNETAARYRDDTYDRLWSSYVNSGWDYVNTTADLNTSGADDFYHVPVEVLRTAARPWRGQRSLSYSERFSFDRRHCYVYFYLAEIEKIPPNQKREFTITIGGVTYGPITPEYLKPLTISVNYSQVGGTVQFSINSTKESDLPPILNAFEILSDYVLLDSPTNAKDVDAIIAIKQLYNLNRLDWQGDPCVPRDYPWSGLNCTTINNTPRITSLNLGSSKLTGNIASAFSHLEALRSLDLSNNELTGVIPEFLAQLSNLTVLNLSGNKLTGPIPRTLMEKSERRLLLLREVVSACCGSGPYRGFGCGVEPFQLCSDPSDYLLYMFVHANGQFIMARRG